MTFFARPNLDNVQFKQLSGTVLTLTGQTQILTTTGLTLANGSGNTIVINAKGASIGNVMTYDGTEIKLSAPSSGASTGIYTCASPTTCTVGGLPAGSPISGCTISRILEEILVPTLNPTLTAPSNLFILNPGTPAYEVGTSVNIDGCIIFDQGCINPQYTASSDKRSGNPNTFKFQDFNGLNTCVGFVVSCSCCFAMPARVVTLGANTAYGSVCYDAGVQPKNSSGANFSSPLAAGFTAPVPQTINGLYPYFYGKVASGGAPAGSNRPTPTASLVTGGTKVVADSNSTICINFGSNSDQYIWFATPNSSPTKTCWFIDALNSGPIGGAVSPGGNLFPNLNSVVVTTACWAGQTYKLYISNYQSAVSATMELRN